MFRHDPMIAPVAAGTDAQGLAYGATVLERLLLEDGFEQRGFVGEIDVERALGDLRRARDLAHAGAVKPQIHEHLAGAVEDLAALGAVLLLDDVQMITGSYNHWFRVSEGFWRGQPTMKRK